MKTKQFTYREMVLSSSQVEVPRQTYQRNFNAKRAQKIAEEFDERIANEPKVSYRDNRFFVFDGQHTIAARKLLNNGADLTAVQHLLGHQSLATTQVYTHITYRELQKNYQLAHPRASKRKGG